MRWPLEYQQTRWITPTGLRSVRHNLIVPSAYSTCATDVTGLPSSAHEPDIFAQATVFQDCRSPLDSGKLQLDRLRFQIPMLDTEIRRTIANIIERLNGAH